MLPADEPEVRLYSIFALGELRAQVALDPLLRRLAKIDERAVEVFGRVADEACRVIRIIRSSSKST
jgi:HEAT repeat protein